MTALRRKVRGFLHVNDSGKIARRFSSFSARRIVSCVVRITVSLLNRLNGALLACFTPSHSDCSRPSEIFPFKMFPTNILLRSVDLWIKGSVKSRAFLLRRDASSPSRLARLTDSFIQKCLHLSKPRSLTYQKVAWISNTAAKNSLYSFRISHRS